MGGGVTCSVVISSRQAKALFSKDDSIPGARKPEMEKACRICFMSYRFISPRRLTTWLQ